VQFATRNFIELLEVDRPSRLDDHQLSALPRQFSFGAHNRAFLAARTGMSMLALTSTDTRADLARFEAAGLDTSAPFDFERKATLPDGSQATVAFTLGFVTHPLMPGMAFFVCENRFPEYFWKPAFQSHPNGAQSLAAVYIEADAPDALVDFLTTLTGGKAQPIDDGQRITCGAQELLVMTPKRIREVVPNSQHPPSDDPSFAGVAIASPSTTPHTVPAQDACGIFVEWRAA
jgi:hypothetical protein